jgi:hypothetical protein
MLEKAGFTRARIYDVSVGSLSRALRQMQTVTEAMLKLCFLAALMRLWPIDFERTEACDWPSSKRITCTC